MFYCEFCGREFTRKFNLARHLKTKHKGSNDVNGTKNITVNEYNDNGISNDGSVSNTTNKTDINNNCDANDINEENNDNNESPPLETNNFIQEFPDKKDDFNQRILVATEAIKRKFNLLKNNYNGIHNVENMNPNRRNQEKVFMNTVPENDNTIKLAKLSDLLQCALDILMIKELKNVDITDKDEANGDKEDKDVKLKRSFNPGDEAGKEYEPKSSEEIPFKRLKYKNSMDNDHDNSSMSLQCVDKKYWHDPNTLVDELRNLINNSDIGQQILNIFHRLKKSNIKSVNYFEYIMRKEERDELMRDLNLLKKTSIGQQIFCIFNELEKAGIIEAIEDVTDEIEHLSDDEENQVINDIDESVTTEEED